jgi:hypothetical protein
LKLVSPERNDNNNDSFGDTLTFFNLKCGRMERPIAIFDPRRAAPASLAIAPITLDLAQRTN